MSRSALGVLLIILGAIAIFSVNLFVGDFINAGFLGFVLNLAALVLFMTGLSFALRERNKK